MTLRKINNFLRNIFRVQDKNFNILCFYKIKFETKKVIKINQIYAKSSLIKSEAISCKICCVIKPKIEIVPCPKICATQWYYIICLDCIPRNVELACKKRRECTIELQVQASISTPNYWQHLYRIITIGPMIRLC